MSGCVTCGRGEFFYFGSCNARQLQYLLLDPLVCCGFKAIEKYKPSVKAKDCLNVHGWFGAHSGAEVPLAEDGNLSVCIYPGIDHCYCIHIYFALAKRSGLAPCLFTTLFLLKY